MHERGGVRPEHDSGVPSTASTETPQAPDEPIGGFTTANDPTGGRTWVRRRFRLPAAEGADEALDAVLQVPGVARASLEERSRELIADVELGVVSDDELTAAIGRGGLDVEAWDDEPIPPVERSDIVDEESEDSFPASDAPSSWARAPDDDRT